MTNTKISLETGRDWLIRQVTNETFIYVIKRLLQALLTIFLASALSFFIMQVVSRRLCRYPAAKSENFTRKN